MAKFTIVSMPGDGIGKTVLPEAIRVLDAVGFDATYVHGDIGWEFWCTEGNALPDRTIALLDQHKLGLFGAITSKPKKEADAELAPELRGRGLSYYSPIVTMRQRFGLDICLRPCRSFPGNPLNFVRRAATGGFEEPKVDAVIFRQNTEGSYTGVEWTNPPQQVREAFATHPRFVPFAGVAGADLAISTRIVTRPVEEYGVIVCENLFGDIISDAFAGLVGGLGFACSGNIGPDVAVFEPTHGSVPKYEQLDPSIVNPIAMILSAAMLCDHVGETEKGDRIRAAIARVVAEGKVRTYDMMRIPAGPKAIAAGAATTQQMTDAILAALERRT